MTSKNVEYEAVIVVEDNNDKEFIEMDAPADLLGGYLLSAATADGRTVSLKVPQGGVRQGERFTGEVVVTAVDASKDNKNDKTHNIPVGHWRDGICDCCKLGCCHPLPWFSYCCSLISLGQVLQRNDLDVFVRPTRASRACSTLLFVLLAYYVSLIVLAMIGTNSVQFFIVVYLVVTLARLRNTIRRRYAIPGSECQDCLYAFFCGSCLLCQLHRHTADHRKYGYSCCTATGLPDDAMLIDSRAAPTMTAQAEMV